MAFSTAVHDEYSPIAADSPLSGMLGIEDFTANMRTESFRANMLRYWPNGTVQLTALTAAMPSKKVDDVKYHWYEKDFNEQRAEVTGVYTDVVLSTLYTSGGVADDFLYIKMSAVHSRTFRAGHQVLMRVSTDSSADVNAKVVSVLENGASSYIKVKLLEDDNNCVGTGTAAHDMSDCDTILINGNINSDGSLRPMAMTRTEKEYANYLQTFRNSVDLTRRRRTTKIRIGDPYMNAKADALDDHMQEMEKAFIWGVPTYNQGSNGQPETTTGGIVSFIREYASENYMVYDLDSEFAGDTWVAGGWEWLNKALEQCFRYTGGGPSRLVYCGTFALEAINRLVEGKSQLNISVGQLEFGIKVMTLISPFGTWHLKIHPLFSHEQSNRRAMLITAPSNLEYRYMLDTTFQSQKVKDNGEGGKDGIDEDYKTDCGLALNFPHTFMYLDGVGRDNTLPND